MLHIYATSIDIIRICAPLVRKLRTCDAHLADQLDRATTRAALNLAEGDGQRDGNRRLSYSRALGEVREARCALDIGEAKGLVMRPQGLDARFDHVIGVLVKLTR